MPRCGRDNAQVHRLGLGHRIDQAVDVFAPQRGHGGWTGLRPATPSNVPIIGRSRLPNLYLNTGHGTLGWTHACGSGKSIARIVSGLAPEIEFAFTGLPSQGGLAASLQPSMRGG